MVEILSDEITIYDDLGCEIVHWVEDEWKEDSSVALCIANAIKVYYTMGAEYLKLLVKI